MLEFASQRPRRGQSAPRVVRAPLELIRAALHDRGSLYAGVLDALCEALPAPTARQVEEARRLAEEGPPAELVGLEPFAAPELAEVGR
jgi:nitrate reductase delta subunit